MAMLMCGSVKAQSTGTSALLFNYVTTAGGYDTGLVINNASLTPFGSAGSGGTCTLSYYSTINGVVSEPISEPTPPIPPGGQFTRLLSLSGLSIQGYAIAVCNFPLAQGVEIIGPVGLRTQSFLPAQSIPPF